jgi:hypothetical protein
VYEESVGFNASVLNSSGIPLEFPSLTIERVNKDKI